MRVGDISIEPVYDGTAVLGTDLFTNSDWSDHQHLLDDQGVLSVPVGAFLVRNGDRLALLDAGVGDYQNEMFDGGALLDSLRDLGGTPGDIDTVIVSHLHTDHMGDIDALWAGGWTSGRPNALRVWGPSGSEESMGTKYAMDNFLRHVNWDRVTRNFKITPVPEPSKSGPEEGAEGRWSSPFQS